MIICVHCQQRTKAELDQLLELGGYRDYSEAVTVAIANLLVLQKHGDSVAPLSDGNGSQPKTETRTLPAHTGTFSGKTLPKLFSADRLDKRPSGLPVAPSGNSRDARITLADWLFGQYNKLLPAKVSVRGLARLLLDEGKGVPVDQACSEIASAAAVLGDLLAAHDKRHEIARDDALATAFPRTGPSNDKSRLRYAKQFVAYFSREQGYFGLLFAMNLASPSASRDPRLTLTDVGWDFAALPNPVLDGGQTEPLQKFSPDEQKFLLDHILKRVPVEEHAYRTILDAVTDGADTPDRLDEALQSLVPQLDASRQQPSASYWSSQRSGAVSRMTDLGLMGRRRDGIRVSYVVTEVGKHFLSSLERTS